MTLADLPQRNFKLICLLYSKTNVLEWIIPCTSCSWCDKADFENGECAIKTWMAEATWSQLPKGTWIWLRESHFMVYSA